MKCKFGISKIDLRKINRNLPYVYTEQGVAMLSSVLHTDRAIEMSIKIINAFVAMRKFISDNYNMLKELDDIKNLTMQNTNDIKLLQDSFSKYEDTSCNKIFYEGQIYDAYSLLIDIFNKAKKEIIIIDNYAGKELLDIIKNISINVFIISDKIDNILRKKYNSQYSNVTFIQNDSFHDWFIIIDREELYHSDASFKDLGKKCFAINKMESKMLIDNFINSLGGNNEKKTV